MVYPENAAREVYCFKNKEDMFVAIDQNNLQHCNTYFDPQRGWVVEKLIEKENP